MSATAASGLLLGTAFGGCLIFLAAAVAGWRPRSGGQAPTWITTIAGPQARRRLAIAVGVGVVVGVVTRWPVAVAASVALIYLWPTMFGAGKMAAGQIERLDALAVWTESLRDSIAGSVGLEDAIKHSVTAAPVAIQPPLQRLARQLQSRVPLTIALASFSDEFEDASSDLVIAALILNSKLRGPGLVATLSALAVAAREEIDMRRRVEESRKGLRRAAATIVAATAVFAGGVVLFSREYVAPYGTPAGQVMLMIVLGVFAGGLVWIRSAASLPSPERFLVDADQVHAALSAGGERR